MIHSQDNNKLNEIAEHVLFNAIDKDLSRIAKKYNVSIHSLFEYWDGFRIKYTVKDHRKWLAKKAIAAKKKKIA